MPAFEYRALNGQGKEENGVLEADTARQVRQLLRNRDLAALSVQEVARQEKKVGGVWFGGSLGASDLALVTRQMATLIGAGSPLEETLSTIAHQTDNRTIRRIFSALRSKVLEGHSLANALGQFPAAFPVLYRATIGAGEQSGHLEEVLERLADYTENRQLNQQKVSTALAYPILLSLVSVGIVVALLKFVVPNVIGVFDSFGGELPALTRGLIASSDFLEQHGLLLLGAVVSVVIFIAWLWSRENWRQRMQSVLLKLPLVGGLMRGMNSERFARTLSILASSGVPILDAMRISADVISVVPMRKAVVKAADKVREGSAVYKSLEQSGYFPPMVIYLIASGEGRGQLDHMLDRAATQQERETQAKLATFVGLLEPLMILIMGGVVMLIVFAIMLPILDMPTLMKS